MLNLNPRPDTRSRSFAPGKDLSLLPTELGLEAQLGRRGPPSGFMFQGLGVGSPREFRVELGRFGSGFGVCVMVLHPKNQAIRSISRCGMLLLHYGPISVSYSQPASRVIAPIAAGEPLVVLRYEGP